MNLAPVPKQRYFTQSGTFAPLNGGLLYTYLAGTATPVATYTDSSGGTPNANPVVLDSQGYADVWIDPSISYKFILKDSLGNTLWTEDNITTGAGTGFPKWSSTATYSTGDLVADSSGSGLIYRSRTNNNSGNALTSVTNWALAGGGNVDRTVTANTTLAVTDHGGLIRSNSTSGSITHTLPACSTSPIGLTITIKDVGTNASNTTSVKGNGTDTVDGNVTYSTALRGGAGFNDSLTVRNTGSTWDVL